LNNTRVTLLRSPADNDGNLQNKGYAADLLNDPFLDKGRSVA
jgi:hypothetical protein